jgi:phosphoribosylformimino-5-aminoimidazole carboxamide ribotide isomerase
MLLIPAIDLKDGKCVRLRQGRMNDETIFADDPVEMAEKWVDAGCKRLHLIDLNGAFEGEPVNADVINRICEAFPDVRGIICDHWHTSDQGTAFCDRYV